jgi:DNA-binding phage protein
MSTERSVDPTDDLRTNEAIEAFIEAAAETGDIVYQVDCEQIVARARKRWGLKEANA